MDWTNYMSPFLSFFLALIQFTLSELTPEQCRDMGFSVNLLCSSCDELKPFNLTESSLEQNCRKCCHADGQDEVAKVWIKYVSLIAFRDIPLVLLKCVTESWGGSLKYRFVRGADPILKLHDENNDVKEVLSIEKWNTDSVEEFLNERLVK